MWKWSTFLFLQRSPWTKTNRWATSISENQWACLNTLDLSTKKYPWIRLCCFSHLFNASPAVTHDRLIDMEDQGGSSSLFKLQICCILSAFNSSLFFSINDKIEPNKNGNLVDSSVSTMRTTQKCKKLNRTARGGHFWIQDSLFFAWHKELHGRGKTDGRNFPMNKNSKKREKNTATKERNGTKREAEWGRGELKEMTSECQSTYEKRSKWKPKKNNNNN